QKTPQISIGDGEIVEGDRGQKKMTFQVKLSNPSNKTVTVNYTTVDGTAKSGKDFQQKRGVVTFRPGETKKTVNISVFGDVFLENLELFQVKLTSAQNGEFSGQRDQFATGIIQDNDKPPQISISDSKVTEGNRGKKNMEFEVKLNNPSDRTVRVNYETVEGSAKSGKDFQNQKGVVTFKPGQTKKTVNVPTLGDTFVEKTEQFQVKLSGAQNAELSDSKGVGRIQDNDIVPKISIRDARTTEGDRGQKNMKFEVKLDNSSSQTVKVNYETVEGSAKSGEDFQKKKGVLTFKPGERKKTVNVPILGDTDDEANENFEVRLSGAKNGKLSDGKAVGIIRDNDREAIDLGVLSEKAIFKADNIGFTTGGVNRDTEDYFRFEVKKEGLVNIFMDVFVQDIGMELYDQDDSLLFQSNVEGLGFEAIENVLEPGVYYLRVFPVGPSRTKYNLSINIIES
ncbi:MAG: sodium:calcium exchanger, partial [Trichodesmium sp. St19_bin2]|nr:sodium:calcium exchanger [Trichodesmium sp. St19_bin2]